MWERIEKWQKNLDSKMTKKRYLDMMEQLGQEPKMEEMPPDYEDFPDIVIDAIETFNSLGDRIFGDVGYTGKDYTNLPYYIRINNIAEDQEELFLDILLRSTNPMKN